jgi:hypothetical protein
VTVSWSLHGDNLLNPRYLIETKGFVMNHLENRCFGQRVYSLCLRRACDWSILPAEAADDGRFFLVSVLI